MRSYADVKKEVFRIVKRIKTKQFSTFQVKALLRLKLSSDSNIELHPVRIVRYIAATGLARFNKSEGLWNKHAKKR